ncbi:MAG TPA: hypothetical protein VG297_11355 [Bryobacteraceae bacterium]|jgi:hypothetical protein|nr:hypothetical protein [Bryobacteraceae bacterium]
MDRAVVSLVDALQRQFPVPPSGKGSEGWNLPPLNILDCVLSLNRRYDSFCLPRVQRFADRRPEIDELAALLRLIRSFPTSLEFSVSELNYRDEKRSLTLLGVTEYFIAVQQEFDGASEALRLQRWAETAKPADYEAVGVRGFGLSGFQYLRMLFGAQAVKPDIHIRRFVSTVLGRPVDDLTALALLEAAGRHLDWKLTALDYAIWDRLARTPSDGSQRLTDA